MKKENVRKSELTREKQRLLWEVFNMKKYFIMVAVMSIALLFCANSVQAAENQGVSLEPPKPWTEGEGGISTRGTTPPSKDNLYTNNQYVSFGGSANNSYLYTDYCFHDIYQITCQVENNSSSDLEVTLCYYSIWIGDADYSTKQKITVSANSTKTIYFRDLDERRYYFLRFSAPSDFSGRVLGFQQ